MIPFATEFAVDRTDSRAAFIAEVVAWLRGNERSTVLTSESAQELDGANAHILAESGEELRFRELQISDQLKAIGFRHDLPDDEGRLWRTEGVLRCAGDNFAQDVIRVRTQCLARMPGAHLESPRKPYLIKALLKGGWGGADGELPITDSPIWLSDDEQGLECANSILSGGATKWLPTIFVSASGEGRHALSQRELEKLAYDLGGVAHVVVEPSRKFSLRVRNVSEGRNVYGGTIGTYVPGQGLRRRHYLGWQLENRRNLAEAVRNSATEIRAEMPAEGWDWSELQEHALREQRATYRGAMTASEAADLVDRHAVQLQELRAEIGQLRTQLSGVPREAASEEVAGFHGLAQSVGPEIYPGEMGDRLRLAVLVALESADAKGLDNRSRVLLQRFADRMGRSPHLDTLLNDIDRATKDPKRIAREIVALLQQHGYREKSDNKHIRLEPLPKFDGLSSITVPKTPGESRGLKNFASQVKLIMGIGKLPD